ncbi:MAG: hypothetical protein E7510_08755 [Ruminococcus sp.]|nr:hypothetical protein [Ruminococcus sp.]
MHVLDMHTKAKKDFIECFKENILEPRNLDYKLMFCGPTGTNANEAALTISDEELMEGMNIIEAAVKKILNV